MVALPSNSEKREVWRRYAEGHPIRVPLRWNANPRIILLDETLNPENWTFEEYSHDPEVLMQVQARLLAYRAEMLGLTCDFPNVPPDVWEFRVDPQNIYDAAYFGAEIVYEPGQVPATCPPFALDDVDTFLADPLPPPHENPWLLDRLRFHARLTQAAKHFKWRHRPARVAPFALGFDGPVTVAMNLFGSDILLLMATEPRKAYGVFEKITREVARRNAGLARRAGLPFPTEHGGLADDSIQLITTHMYKELVLPVHKLWYQLTSTATRKSGKRSIHLCGDATRHFPIISKKLGVASFDTGFPVDHGALRRELGETVEISGGPPASLLLNGPPEACAESAHRILKSGVKQGGRFILQEGNNLPPCTPIRNLAAVYLACLVAGQYS